MVTLKQIKMKQINEQFRRMQKLAGLITENFDEGLLMMNPGESTTFGDITFGKTYVVIGSFGNFKKGDEIEATNVSRRADGEKIITFKSIETGKTDTVIGSPDETINVSSMLNEITEDDSNVRYTTAIIKLESFNNLYNYFENDPKNKLIGKKLISSPMPV